jgi:DNA-directed RNA polymerase specialized sigma24 family protein
VGLSWFLDILEHYLIDEQRRREAKGGRSTQAASDPVAQSVLDLIETREPGPAHEAQRAEAVEAVRLALRRLSVADREIVLAFKDGVSIDQIALTTGRTYKQTRLDIDKLLARLRAELRVAAG